MHAESSKQSLHASLTHSTTNVSSTSELLRCLIIICCSRGTEVFSVRTNTAANSEATFILQYEDLIIRRRSKYQQVLNLNPGAVVEDLKVEVKVLDKQGVVGEEASEFVTTEKISDSEVVFSYSPSAEQQLEDSEYGLARDLSVEYDVVHPPTGAGQFVVDKNCYFAQFFSPSGIEAVPVDLVFVIDVSGSMSGRKIEQTREALETIINQLGSSDRFTMVTFSNQIHHWRETLVPVSEYRQQGVQFARGLQADGGTDFNNGLLSGASILKTYGRSDHVPLLVILTDGRPTVGVTRENVIVDNATRALAGTAISLNCLGFGFDLNYQLLERLSLANNGVARRIYEGEDAPEQLEGFFEEISSPILRDISITYNASLELITDTHFPILFNGSEIVVAGRYNCSLNGSDTMIVTVNGTGVSQEIVFNSEVNVHQNVTIGNITSNMERLAAYLVVKQLIQKLHLTDSEEEANIVKRQALTFALKYNFVTELTSLIVVEEGTEDGEGKNLESPAEGGWPLQDATPFNSPPLFAAPLPPPPPSQPSYLPPSTSQPPASQPLYLLPSTPKTPASQPSYLPPSTSQPSTSSTLGEVLYSVAC